MLSLRHNYSWHVEAWSGSCRTVLLGMGKLKWPDTRVCALLYHSLWGFHLALDFPSPWQGCCNPCPYRIHSSHWQLLSVKTGSMPSHPPLQKAFSSPRWHLRMLCCSSERSEITPAAPLGHCSGRLPLSTVLILYCTIAAGSPCLFNFPLLALQTLGPTMLAHSIHPLLQPCQRPPVLWLHSAMCERKAIKEHCPSNYNTAFSTCSHFSIDFFFFGCYCLGFFQWLKKIIWVVLHYT